MYFLRLSRYH
ncbi:unnamed protein product [Spodoptera littoralis]|uniref:Uncharacterized protein n=1 Tax=Spodoptera littoralis TaxID=7109 RepID=A0A9P0HZS5_SPOLI|nr:unnamed protein product [Spodoptera littoralis]CAH1636770.1 unnamed protein product [Spodoptera littoralis]